MSEQEPKYRAARSVPLRSAPPLDARTVRARWCDWHGSAVEHLVLKEDADGFIAEAALLAGESPNAFAAWYRIAGDPAWRVRKIEIGIVGDARRLTLTSSGEGRWSDAAGAPLPALDGASDGDFSASPFTNTLPIRRLELDAGASADIAVVSVHFPDLCVTVQHQRYTCLEPRRRYRFESVTDGFVRELEVDARGLVITYPGLFTRTL